MFYLVPPAGTPISAANIFSTLMARFSSKSYSQAIDEEISKLSMAKHCYFLNSGRAALTIILKALSKENGKYRNEVIIPAYTCFSVAAAIASCNLKIRPVDINPMTLDYDYNALSRIPLDRALAIVGCNLFGIPSDWMKLTSFAKKYGIMLIDDAAQAMGCTSDGKQLGTFGDAGFYSLGRGKDLAAYSGGIILTDDEQLSIRIIGEQKGLKNPSIYEECNIFAKILLYTLFLNPYYYWLVDSMPLLGIGKTVFDMDFQLSKLSKFQICLVKTMLPKLASFNNIRKNNAALLSNGIANLGDFHVPGWQPESEIPYLRLPVLCPNNNIRNKSIAKLRKAGISSSGMYPSSIRNIAGIERYLADLSNDFPGADTVVQRLLTLPTHPKLKPKHINRIIKCFESLLKQ